MAGELTEIVYREVPLGGGRQMWRYSYRRVGHQRFAFVDPTSVGLAEHGVRRVHVVGGVSGGAFDR